jgi:hypothetical protein
MGFAVGGGPLDPPKSTISVAKAYKIRRMGPPGGQKARIMPWAPLGLTDGGPAEPIGGMGIAGISVAGSRKTNEAHS